MLCWLGCQGIWTKGRCALQTTAEDWSSLPKCRTQLVGNNRCPIRKPQSENKPKGLEASCLQSPGAADMGCQGGLERWFPESLSCLAGIGERLSVGLCQTEEARKAAASNVIY